MAEDENSRPESITLEETISHYIRLALFDILVWMPYTDIVLTGTFGSWKDTWEDHEVAKELKNYAEWVISAKMGRKVDEATRELTPVEKNDPDRCIQLSLASIFQQVGRKRLSVWTYNWAEKKITDKAYWENLEGWIQKNLPHVETQNTELLAWYIKRGKQRQARMQKLLSAK